MWNRINIYKTIRFTFVNFLVGIIIHLPMMVNGLHNHDSIVLSGNDMNWLITQGKWFATPFSSIEGIYDIYYLSGLIGLLAYSLAATCIVFSLKIENNDIARVVGGCIMSFPAVGTALIYHASDYFGGSFFVAAMGCLFIITDGILGDFLGLLFICLSIGAYQANVSVALTILLIDVILDMIRDEESYLSILKKSARYILITASSTVLYYLILKVIVKVKDVELSSYKGIDNMFGVLSPSVLFNSTVVAYKNFVEFYLRGALSLYRGKSSWLGITLCMLLGLMVIFYGIKKHTSKEGIIKFLILLIYVFIGIPLCANFIGVLSQNTSFYYITIVPFVLVSFVPLLIIDKLCQMDMALSIGNIQILQMLKIVSLAITVLLCFSWIIEENTVYQEFGMINKEYDAKLPVLVNRIQSMEGYTNEKEVVIVGNTPYGFLESGGVLSSFENTFNTYGYGLGGGAGEIYSEGVLYSFLANKYSTTINFVGNEDILSNNRQVIDEMPVYPADGSLKILDDKIVVKLSGNY